ncbi:hypothetical protein EON68_02575 [archaeon]|nr:MAG: hypothetical protein EON68_02575 [archaeon]
MDMKEHDVMEEVRAVRNCFARVDETEKLLATRRGETVSKLDVPAAGRFIAAAIGPAGAAASTGSNARGSGGASSMLAPPTASASRAAASSMDSDSEEVEEERGASTTAPAAGAVAGGKRSASGTSSASSRGAPPSKRRAGGTDAGSGDAVQGGAPGAKPKSLDDKRRSTPQPRLSHLNWKEEMSKKFGRA